MRIAHIVCSYPPYYGGMGNVVFQTAAALSKQGHTVEVLTPGMFESGELKGAGEQPKGDHAEALQGQIDYATRLKPSFRYGNAARLPTIGKELDRFDIVHLHYPFFGTANLVRKWKLRNPSKPLVVTYHMDARSPGWKGLVFKLYTKFWMPKILGVADAVIGSSFDYIEVSDARNLFEKEKNKWHALPFGVDTRRFDVREKPEEIFSRLGLDSTAPTVLFVGGMDAAHHFKGIPVLLKALAGVKKMGTLVQCLFVGDGELRKQYSLMARGMGIAAHTRFVGRISDEELPGFYNAADLTILPSVHRGEAFGMVLLESMASGVPVIASDLPGVRTVANDGGMTFPVGEHRQLAEFILGYFSQHNKHEWQLRVRAIAENKYSWEHIVLDLDKLYTDLLRNR